MKTIKASLKINKNGRLFCALHKTYKVAKPPTTDCKICWVLYNNCSKQEVVNETVSYVTELLDSVGH
jgi:hypothetical protein